MKFLLFFFLLIILLIFILNKNNENFYTLKKKIKIGIIIPVTSNKRNYRNVEEIDFFKILLGGFIKTHDISGKFHYNFYLGYDHDDSFYIENKTNIINHFNNQTNKYDYFKLKLIKINNLKGKLGEIWSRLADISVENGDTYLYQLGDDIKFISTGWEEKFINKLKEFNNIGVVGPRDTNNSSILTQSFVHKTHLDIFDVYYPKEIKNWHIDRWISDVYKPNNYYMFNKINVKNDGGPERYDVVVMKDAYIQSLVSNGKKKLEKFYKKQTFEKFTNFSRKDYSNKLSIKDIENIKKGQKIMTNMFKVFDRICRENNLKYWCYSGTLLGVIRHKGWIPWDGDIDVCMLEKDFNKFNKIASKFLPENIWLQNYEDKHYKIAPGLIKLRALNSCYLNFPAAELHGHNGLQIDIFKVIKKKNIYKVEKESYNTFLESDIFPLKKDKFEDISVFIPNNSDKLLKSWYKNYYSLPSQDNRLPHEGRMDANNTCNNHYSLYPELYKNK